MKRICQRATISYPVPEMMISIPFFVFLVLAFLTGYVSFAHIFVKQLREADIRQHGNSGAANASPLSERKLLIVILALDALQGMATAWLLPQILWLLADLGTFTSITFYNYALSPKGVQLCMGMAAFLGRYYSPFLGFKGGKGVAMALGVFLVVSWKATVLTAIVCLIIAAWRQVSAASIVTVAAILLPAAMLTFQLLEKNPQLALDQKVSWQVLKMTVLIAVVVVIRHRANIKHLLKGKEHKAVSQEASTILERRRILKEVRREVWNRDNGKCTECGAKDYLEYDHIIPVSKGGSNTVNNIQLLCRRWNRKNWAHI